MFKVLINWYSRKVAALLPTSLQTMKESLQEGEASYLRAVNNKEYYACQAEVSAVVAKHKLARCKRLMNFIQSEERAQAEVSAEDIQMSMMFDSALEEILTAVTKDLKDMEERSTAKKVPDVKS